MLEKEFTTYEQALALKGLEFDEDCLAVHSINLMTENEDWELRIGGVWTNQELVDSIKAPTYSQAFKFFREKYGLHQYIKQYCGERFYFHIEDMVHPRRFDEYTVEMLRSFNESTSQEEAELECLKKLIEIVKTK